MPEVEAQYNSLFCRTTQALWEENVDFHVFFLVFRKSKLGEPSKYLLLSISLEF